MPDSFAVVDAKYLDNADYYSENSIPKCKLFIQACIQLERLLFQSASGGGAGVEEQRYRVESIREECREAKAWLAVNDVTRSGLGTGANAVYFDTSQFRTN